MIDIIQDKSLLAHNTFGFDVKAAVWAEYDSVESLREVLSHPLVAGKRLLHIGKGSNLLFAGDYDGVVLHSRIDHIEILSETEAGEVTVSVGSGVLWDDFCRWAIEQRLYGSENLSGIPGECGAAVVQNIGAYGAEIADLVHEVKTLDTTTGAEKVFSKKECRYAYRYSAFKSAELSGRYIVTSASLTLRRQADLNLDYGNIRSALAAHSGEISLELLRDTILSIRDSKLPHPSELGNAGSFFKNPIVKRQVGEDLKAVYPFVTLYDVDKHHCKIPAAWLIEQCGWKGRKMGGAGVYSKQCLVLVNHGDATPAEVIALSEAIVRTIKDRFDILIEPEVAIIR